MAEKEERIVIKKQINYHPPYGGWCGDGKEIVLTRQDIIEKIAKAICREDNCLDSCEECVLGFGVTAEEKEQFCQKQIIMSRDLSASYVCRAEAALNALLGEDK